MIKQIAIIVGDTVILVTSCLLLRKDKGKIKKRANALFFSGTVINRRLVSRALLKLMLLEEKSLI
ncbi:hypothetical protein F8160_02895 [Bacillus sp. CH126_4D]|nr:hypothetical protein F8162_23355 [Bacillus sp. CH140a_4T]KAB2474612.1 hypothetical protein F8160_02895 [Bacillus sp. CH126_4D]